MADPKTKIAFYASQFFLPTGKEPKDPVAIWDYDKNSVSFSYFDASSGNEEAANMEALEYILPMIEGLGNMKLNVMAHITLDGYRSSLYVCMDITTYSGITLLSMSNVWGEAKKSPIFKQKDEPEYDNPYLWESFFVKVLQEAKLKTENEARTQVIRAKKSTAKFSCIPTDYFSKLEVQICALAR